MFKKMMICVKITAVAVKNYICKHAVTVKDKLMNLGGYLAIAFGKKATRETDEDGNVFVVVNGERIPADLDELDKKAEEITVEVYELLISFVLTVVSLYLVNSLWLLILFIIEIYFTYKFLVWTIKKSKELTI